MFNVAVYSIKKFIKFNDMMMNKLTIINKHIYEILDQDIDINKLFKKKLKTYKIKSEIFKDVL